MQYDPKTLYIFDSKWKFRQYILRFMTWKGYDYLNILPIIGNSICLAMTDYTDDTN